VAMGGGARRSLARVGGTPDRGNATTRWLRAASVGQGTRGSVVGEVSSAGELGWLGERTSSPRPPGV
jgi:hypothetical protein